MPNDSVSFAISTTRELNVLLRMVCLTRLKSWPHEELRRPLSPGRPRQPHLDGSLADLSRNKHPSWVQRRETILGWRGVHIPELIDGDRPCSPPAMGVWHRVNVQEVLPGWKGSVGEGTSEQSNKQLTGKAGRAALCLLSGFPVGWWPNLQSWTTGVGWNPKAPRRRGGLGIQSAFLFPPFLPHYLLGLYQSRQYPHGRLVSRSLTVPWFLKASGLALFSAAAPTNPIPPWPCSSVTITFRPWSLTVLPFGFGPPGCYKPSHTFMCPIHPSPLPSNPQHLHFQQNCLPFYTRKGKPPEWKPLGSLPGT